MLEANKKAHEPYPLIFDTHKFIKSLKHGGFSEQQAEVLAEEQVIVLNTQLATKQDIEQYRAEVEQYRTETKREIEQYRADTKREIEQYRADTKREIEQVHLKIEHLRADTKRDIEQSRADTKKDIDQVHLKIEHLRVEIERTKSSLIKWMFGMLLTFFLTFSGLIIAFIQLSSQN